MDPIREKLMQLDILANTLQQQNKYLETLKVFEEMLMIKKSAYGEDSEEYFKTSDKLCELCNLISMIFLQKEKFDSSLEFLKRADMLAQSSSKYKSITYNNLACFYRRSGKLRSALNYLQQALDIEIKSDNPQSLADTHLNMCAVLSQLNRHQEALEHALLSVVLLQDEFLAKPQQSRQEESQQEQSQKTTEDRVSVLSIAYHNLGVELEYLKRYDESIQTYQKAVRFATTHLQPNHQLIENLRNVLNNAQEQITSQKMKEQKRRVDRDQQARSHVTQKISKVSNLYQNQQKMGQTHISQNTQNQGFGPYKQQNTEQAFVQNQQKLPNPDFDDLKEQQNLENEESSLNDNQHDELNQAAQQQLLKQHQQPQIDQNQGEQL